MTSATGTRAGWGFAVVCAFAVAACGGATFTEVSGDAGGGGGGDSGTADGGSSDGSGGDSGGGNGDAASGDSGGGGGSPACPATMPGPGPCPIEGAECEYGKSPAPSCNQIARCGQNGWEFPQAPACATGTCPSRYQDVPQGQQCTPEGLACGYDKGDCYCTNSGPGGTTMNPRWVCVPTPNNCPAPRPDIGTACTKSQDGLSCDYGSCTGGVALECKDGYWQQVFTPCPL